MALYSEEEKQELTIRYCNENPNLTTSHSLRFSRWLRTGDPDYLDKMIMDMCKDGCEVKGVVLEQMAIAALKRLLREYKYTKKTVINNDVMNDETNWIIFKLIHFCNKTREDATFLMAGLLDRKFPFASKKSSYLDIEYSRWTKESQSEIEYVKSIKPDGWTTEEQNSFLELLPDIDKIPKALKGNRRD